MNEVLGGGQPEQIDPIVKIGEVFAELSADRQRLESELEEVTRTQSRAVQEASRPFDTRIRELTTGIEQIKEQQDPENARDVFEEMMKDKPLFYKDTLDLLIQKYYGPVHNFVNGVERAGRHDYENRELDRFRQELGGIIDLKSLLGASQEPLPVAFYGVTRWEERDEQAQWEGRDSSTGIFHDDLFGYKGMAKAGSLLVRKSIRKFPDQLGFITMPHTLDLDLEQAEVFHTEPTSWDFPNFARGIVEGKMVVTLLRRRTEDDKDSARLASVAWGDEKIRKGEKLKIAIGAEAIAAVSAQWARE